MGDGIKCVNVTSVDQAALYHDGRLLEREFATFQIPCGARSFAGDFEIFIVQFDADELSFLSDARYCGSSTAHEHIKRKRDRMSRTEIFDQFNWLLRWVNILSAV